MTLDWHSFSIIPWRVRIALARWGLPLLIALSTVTFWTVTRCHAH
jgi:hypothetical protein